MPPLLGSGNQSTDQQYSAPLASNLWKRESPAWWCHRLEIFSALLAICAGNSPVPGEFPAQRPVTRSFDVSLICVRINGPVNNSDAGDLWRHRVHYDVIVMGHRRWRCLDDGGYGAGRHWASTAFCPVPGKRQMVFHSKAENERINWTACSPSYHIMPLIFFAFVHKRFLTVALFFTSWVVIDQQSWDYKNVK